MRFQRKIRIAKGVHLNMSKSGLGLSMGPRGAKISVGPKGVYSNVGIPGTGISKRTKLSNLSTTPRNTLPSIQQEREYNVDILIDDETGEEQVLVYENSQEVTDLSIIRKITRDQVIKDRISDLREKTRTYIEDKVTVLTTLHTLSEDLPSWESYLTQLKQQSTQSYHKELFSVTQPTRQEISMQLEEIAKKTITPLFGKKKKQRAYVDEHLEGTYQKALKQWTQQKEEFNQQESEKKLAIDTQRALSAKLITSIEQPSNESITEALEAQFEHVVLPVEFFVACEVDQKEGTIYLDLDLPEIEDFPQKRASILASGKLSIKNRSAKQLRSDYLMSVTSMAFYFASLSFSVSPAIEHVVISAFTQRRNKATGNIEDQYIYSVHYDIDTYKELNVKYIDPVEAMKLFEHRIDVRANNDMKVITPLAKNTT